MKIKDIEKVIEELKAVGAEVTVEQSDCEFCPSTTYSYKKLMMSDWGGYLGSTWGFITVRPAGEYRKKSSVSVSHHNYFDEGQSTKSNIQWTGFSEFDSSLSII